MERRGTILLLFSVLLVWSPLAIYLGEAARQDRAVQAQTSPSAQGEGLVACGAETYRRSTDILGWHAMSQSNISRQITQGQAWADVYGGG